MTFFRIESDPPALQVDVVYATPDNFMGRVLYDAPIFALIEETIVALKKAKAKLKQQGYGLILLDGYRPFNVQALLWDLIQDERYVSDPHKTGGRHTRGTAVDLTLTNLSGKPLQMPTPFDDLTERASYACHDFSEEVLGRRHSLCHAMEDAGFVRFPTEWWHFDLVGWEKYPPQDVPLSHLAYSPLVKI